MWKLPTQAWNKGKIWKRLFASAKITLQPRARLQRHLLWPASRLDREMRRRLILQEKYDLLAKGFLLPTLSTSILFICFWIDLVRLLVTTGNTSAVARYTRVLKYRKIQGPRFHRNCMMKKSDKCIKWLTWHITSIIAENKSHAHHDAHLHTVKVYNTWPSQFC